ncbi:uncharacterized protein PFL1_04553 [Pseudozyma flocculosa PF-1]|uniref:Related to oxidoreductase related to nitroreductase n=2 Tax=Pseudozyma flocculosa TaxID=84751 RepID=A0A5C3F9D7_9BASI|nr:uncharacterized protein PFL1_04553 [Pseudozyma flocculosa PF-1]EPQ27808.1 hypothetical protein PFL1_04553 [Pseudozyma flocculosa PF-1]SPO41064.1 related to oxidoreductase related to nitroreductase [Pseudozyma flocculosa]
MSAPFISALAARRSIYALSKKAILSDEAVVSLVQKAVKYSPSSFNSMSSRAVVLLGKEHDHYWTKIVPDELRKVTPPDALEKGLKRVEGFAAGYGTVLFFEDASTVKGLQEKLPLYASSFPQWSEHASGMAQLATWTALELEGYGANLQHYANLTQPAVRAHWQLDDNWVLKSELVFGHPEGGPSPDKPFLADEERVKVFK